ncbi:magnesium transporter NIPA-domain-containing protein [Chlamydoabsidia padenii]|nr:magnesium transporter NIPA-domain-containing protein [Chlamydoabsidia padenii]
MDADQEERDLAFKTFIGVVVSVCGNALISVALNVQKLAHNKLQEKQMANYFANMDEPPRWISSSSHNTFTGNAFYPDDGYSSPRTSVDLPPSSEEDMEHQRFIMAMAQEQREGDSEYLRSKLWWLGISLMILGEVGNFVAYGFAPASTIAPLGTTTLVANVIMAPLMLKEVFRKRDLLGIILAVMGAAVVVLSSNEQETALSPDLIMEALMQTRSIVYFITTGIAIVALTAASPWYGSQSILVDLGLVAIYGGYTVLCTKSVASLLSLTLLNMFAYPISYVLILTLVITAILQIKYLNKALQRFDSTAVIPTQFVLFTVSAIIGSAVIYHDFDNMSLEQMSRFMSGCAVEFIGVYLITSKRNKIGALALQPDKDELPGLANESTTFATTPRTSLDEAIEDRNTESQPGISHHHQQHQHTGIELGGPFASGRTNAIITHHHQQPQQHHYPTTFTPQGLQHHPHYQYYQSNDYQSILQDKQRRRSSYIRGLSLASQLVDRTNDETEAISPLIQLPTPSTSSSSLPSAPTQNNSSSRSHRRTESKLNNLLLGLSNMAHDVLSAGGTNPSTIAHHSSLEEVVDEETAAENEIHRTTKTSSSSSTTTPLNDSNTADQQYNHRPDDVDLMEMGHP